MSKPQQSSSKESLQKRSKYIDHSLEFLNWVNRLGFEKTFFGRLTGMLDEKFNLRRLSLLFLFSLALAFMMFFDFDFSYSARTGDHVLRDIKSPLSFEVVDEVSTEEKRRAAEGAVAMVFDYDRGIFEETYNHLYVAFRRMREEVRKVTWKRDEFEKEDQIRLFFRFKSEFEKTLSRPIPDQTFEWLIQQRFSPRIENMLAEIFDRWASYKIVDGFEKVIPNGTKEVLMREVSRGGRGRESMVSVRDLRDLRDIGAAQDFRLSQIPGFSFLNAKDQHMMQSLSQALLAPNVTLNKQETESRRQKSREEVSPLVIAIKKNQIIVPEGSVVQPIHVTLLREIENHRSNRNRNFIALVSAVMFVVLLLVMFSYLRRFTINRVSVNAKDIAIMGVVTMTVVAFTKIFLFVTNAAMSSHFGSMIPDAAFLFAAPVAAGPMLVGLLILSGEVVWIFTLFIAVALGLMVEMKFSFMLVTVVGGLAAATGVYACKKRNDIYQAGLRTGLINAMMIGMVIIITSFGEDGFWKHLLWTIPSGLVSGILSSLVTLMLIPLLETIFNCTTDVKLLELSNLNHPLLKEMIVIAPGTYHHSLVVGSMVEAAAEEIGANPLLAKVMSYYHDIGKTQHAGYFIENQKPGQNPHDHLKAHMSKTILIAHVKDGVELGLKHKLGKPIIDGIVQHHGTTLIAFFYHRAQENQNEDMGSISEEEFRYPGPKPQFREAALIMLADSIEAASRSLDEPTPARLQNIVKNIIQRKFMDGQLDQCNLTLKDLSTIEESFIRILLGIYHQRIDYPRRMGGGASEAPVAAQNGGSLVKIGSKKAAAPGTT